MVVVGGAGFAVLGLWFVFAGYGKEREEGLIVAEMIVINCRT
jgi:hypothetical protein